MANITLKEVIHNRDFYQLKTGVFGGTKHKDEAELLEYGAHLLRCELFHLRLAELGVKEEWIDQHKPQFFPREYHVRTENRLIHQNLLREVEYLRADVIVASARLERRRQE